MASINPIINWEQEPGLFICPAVKESKGYEDELKPCVNKYKEWIESKGKKPEIFYLKAKKEGWRYTNNIFFNYAVVVYIPQYFLNTHNLIPIKLNNGAIDAAANAAFKSRNEKNSIKKVSANVFKKKVEIETTNIFKNAKTN